MNIDFLAKEFTNNGWKNMKPDTSGGVSFDLVGYHPVGLTKMHVLIKYLPLLNAKIATQWHSNFEILYKENKPGLLKSEAIVVCLLVENIEEVGLRILSSNFGDATRMLIIADIQNHAFFGNMQSSLKFPVFNGTKKNLEKLLTESLPKAVWLE